MQRKTLAKIDTKRHITHEEGHTVHINWDEHIFCLSRTDFKDLASVLKLGMHTDYSDRGDFSLVRVDDSCIEVWLENTCLSLTEREYRRLMNAALTTETRLHGFRSTEDQPQPITLRLVGSIRPLKPIRHYSN